MSLGTRKEKIVFLGLVPILAAVGGALATVLLSGDSCRLGPGTDFMTVLRDSSLTGPEKIKALEVYRDVTGRPWAVISALISVGAVSIGIFAWAITDRIRGR
jgi:hypothetical protein